MYKGEVTISMYPDYLNTKLNEILTVDTLPKTIFHDNRKIFLFMYKKKVYMH